MFTFIGDLQKDGYEDFVVGAPYDGTDHSGAIYIYRGNPEFNFLDPQVIYASDIGLTKKPNAGFGYSFSQQVLDVDENGRNDFAVGAPFVNQAVLLKTKKTVSLKPNSKLSYAGGAINPQTQTGEMQHMYCKYLDNISY